MNQLQQHWRRKGLVAILLWPVSLLFWLLVSMRRLAYQFGLARIHKQDLPVIVVGNITVGGTGKSPLTAFLVKYFQACGWRPAIVSRGYGGDTHNQPYLVHDDDAATLTGDEPLMLRRQTQVPVCIFPQRAQAVRHIAEHTNANIVISDDGLQHYGMARDREIVVIDGDRRFGNGWHLPAGPLRESTARLKHVDLIVVQQTGIHTDEVLSPHQLPHRSPHNLPARDQHQPVNEAGFSLVIQSVRSLQSGQLRSIEDFIGQRVHAMAGIGYPQRFFDSLCALDIRVIAHPQPDHHVYSAADLHFEELLPILVTAKDAVKLRNLALADELAESVYEVQVDVRPNQQLSLELASMEQQLRERRQDRL